MKTRRHTAVEWRSERTVRKNRARPGRRRRDRQRDLPALSFVLVADKNGHAAERTAKAVNGNPWCSTSRSTRRRKPRSGRTPSTSSSTTWRGSSRARASPSTWSVPARDRHPHPARLPRRERGRAEGLRRRPAAVVILVLANRAPIDLVRTAAVALLPARRPRGPNARRACGRRS